MIEKGNYIPWESRFKRFLDIKLEEGERMWNSIEKEPYKRPMIPNLDNTEEQILEPLSKMTKGNNKQYIAYVKVMNYLLQAIPNHIYNSVEACKNAKDMWEQIKRLMFGSDVTIIIMARIQPPDDNGGGLKPILRCKGYQSQNQDLLMTISELKNKLKTIDKGKNVNTKFDKAETSRILLSVTPLPKNIAVKAKKVSNTKVNADRDSKVKRSLFTTFIAAKSKNLGATSVVAKSKLSVAKTPTATNKVSSDPDRPLDYLEVAFRSNTSYVRNLEGDDLLTSSRESNLYTILISELAASSPVCLMSKTTLTNSWLWHRRLSHLTFGTINQLTLKDLVDGLPEFKYDKDHLCSACEQGKSKKASLPPKLVPSIESKLELLHMDLYGPMRVASINGKKYILVIVDDYSRTEFKNEKLRSFYVKLGIVHNTSVTRTPQQNGVVERRNRTLVKAARIMLIFSKSPEFLWAEAIATACFTHNRSIIHNQYNKTPYELIRRRKPNVQYFHVFGSLCYPTNDLDDLGKMKPRLTLVSLLVILSHQEVFITTTAKPKR
ncbi:retrovirus-related pol polyprotein from transposon TNT 1-94 [Tanacetum coccineum]